MADLRKTTSGYRDNPNGANWTRAFGKLEKLHTDLSRPVVPNLGPVVADGLSVLLMSPTHETSGVGYPAFDTAFGQAGRAVVAPEALTVTRDSSAKGGDAFYAKGASGILYWFGHVDRAPAVGTRFRRGGQLARVAMISKADGGPHCHLGLDVRPLIGKHLAWGRTGSGPPYTFGSPTIGAQLAKELEA